MPDLQFWENRWQNKETGWDLKEVSPPLAAYIDQLNPDMKLQPILIPGCGSGYEALYLIEKGFRNITMLDIAPSAIARLQDMLNEKANGWQNVLRLVEGDFFTHTGQYALILEQTFFCAIDPVLRGKYAQKMHELLIKPEEDQQAGKLAGVMFNCDFEGGPPFGGSEAEYRALFGNWFTIKNMNTCHNSIAPRAGKELFVILEPK